MNNGGVMKYANNGNENNEIMSIIEMTMKCRNNNGIIMAI
jgi:hypothetical protein